MAGNTALVARLLGGYGAVQVLARGDFLVAAATQAGCGLGRPRLADGKQEEAESDQ